MHSTSTSKTRPESGFTLTEILVIAPIALLIIAGFIALMVTLTGDVLASNARTRLIQKTDSALERLEQDVRYANELRQVSFTPTSPQGQKNDDDAFDTYNHYPAEDGTYGTFRILRSYATDKNPLDPSKKLIYTTQGPGSCASPTTKAQNNPYEYDIVYYLKQDSGTLDTDDLRMSLWRRIIFNPNQTPCDGDTPWQRSTCAPGVTGTSCQTEDEKIVDNIVNGGITGYYAATPDLSFTSLLSPDLPFDCILTCPHGHDFTDTNSHSGHTSGDVKNVLSPYSIDGENAASTYISIKTKITAAGRDSEYTGFTYASRLNIPTVATQEAAPAPPPLTLGSAWTDGVIISIDWTWPSGISTSSNYRVTTVCPNNHTTVFTKSSPPANIYAESDYIFLYESDNAATFSCNIATASITIAYELGGVWSQDLTILPSQWE